MTINNFTKITILAMIALTSSTYAISDKAQFKKCQNGYTKSMKAYKKLIEGGIGSNCSTKKKRLQQTVFMMQNNWEHCWNLEGSHKYSTKAEKINQKYEKFYSVLRTTIYKEEKTCNWDPYAFEGV